MTIIWTAQYSYKGPDRVDITTRKTHEHGQWFAPDWITMVKPYLNGTLSEKAYTEMYKARMGLLYIHRKEEWNWLLSQMEVTLVCFCKPGNFCHRVILAKDILDKQFNSVIYRGERNLTIW